MNKHKSKFFRALPTYALIFFSVILSILPLSGCVKEENEEIKKGVTYLSYMESKKTDNIISKIKKINRERRIKEIDSLLEELSNDNADVWKMFDNIYMLGDSRAEGFLGYEYLSEDKVFAKKGANLRQAQEGLDKTVSIYPDNIVFSYGTNDVNGNWSDAESFVSKYEEVVKSYKDKMPESHIYICSIVPVTEHALEKDSTFNNIPEYNSALKDMCERNNYTFINCSSLHSSYVDLYESDGIHFIKDMYPIWAKLIIKDILTHEKEMYEDYDDNTKTTEDEN